MAIFINNIKCETLEEVESQIVNFSEYQKQCFRNDFLGIINTELVKVIPDVTPRQIRQAMVLRGISISQIDSAIDSMPEPNRSFAKIEWEYSIAFQRNNPLVTAIGAIVGKSKDELDELWKLAATL
jgi:hypothetical protein